MLPLLRRDRQARRLPMHGRSPVAAEVVIPSITRGWPRGWSCALTACGGILAADGRKRRLSTAAAAPSLLLTLTSEAQMTTHLQSDQNEANVSRRGLVQALAAGAATASVATPASAQQASA